MKISMGPDQSTSGLVFYFDISNSIKSWRGKPTTNYLANPTQIFNSGEFAQYYDLRAIFETNGLVPYSLSFDMRANKNGNVYWYMQNGSYTKYNFVNNNVNATTNWQRFKIENVTPTGPTASWQANTPGDNRAMLATYTVYGSGVFPQVTNMQLELGAIATPFVNGSRSSTESLLDLTGLNTITINSLTYAADGTFNFNGTTDFASFGNNTAINSIGGTSSITVEAWVRYNSYVGSNGARAYSVVTHKGAPWTWLMENPSNRGRIRFTIGGADVSCADPDVHPLNTWMHWVGTYDGSNMRFFRNGVLKNTVAQTGTLASNSVNAEIGQYSNDYRMNGDISILKIYNRALSAEEIQQNFNAIRGRYGI